jgi:hypothetical protein
LYQGLENILKGFVNIEMEFNSNNKENFCHDAESLCIEFAKYYEV